MALFQFQTAPQIDPQGSQSKLSSAGTHLQET